MDAKLAGLRRYLFEFQFHSEIRAISRKAPTPLTVSAARALRARVDEYLAAEGLSMDTPGLPHETYQAALHAALEGVPGYADTYATDRGANHPTYAKVRDSFFSMCGFADHSPNPVRLPISPYDPRWATRATVKYAGSDLLYLRGEDVDARCGDGTIKALTGWDYELKLFTLNDSGDLTQVGPAWSRDDASGMTELMGYMSRKDYQSVREWVVNQPVRMYMSERGIARAKAILDELDSQGVPYRIVRDRNRGQLAAQVEGTKISVRLTDTRPNENFVGRVYDDGIAIYFSTNYRRDNGFDLYEPTPQDVVALLRVAQGLPVERVDGKGRVGEVNQSGDVYFGETNGRKTSRFAYGTYVTDGRVMRQRSKGGEERETKVFIHRRTDRSETETWFGDAESAETFLRTAVQTAREHVVEELAVDRLIADFEAHREAAEAGEWFPEWSGDEQIALIQRAYWDVLRGAQTTLLRPGFSQEDYDERVAVLADVQVGGETLRNTHDMLAGQVAYVGEPADRVRAHAEDVVDAMVGTYEPRTVHEVDEPVREVTFDPAAVVRYMTSPYGPWRNIADLAAAMRAAGWDETKLSQLQGENSIVTRLRDEMIEFDSSTAQTLDELRASDPEGFMTEMLEVAADTLRHSGVEVTELQVDGQGIISWRGFRRNRSGKRLMGFYNQPEELHGQIGQIFSQGEHGEVVTRFASGTNYMFVPGYEARVVPQKPGENLTMEERTRLRGYRQIMAEAIRYQLAGDSLTSRTRVGGPTVLNGVYRRLYDERHEVDFLERAEERGLGRGWAEAILATEARRVRYPNEMAETFYEAWAVENGVFAFDQTNDNFRSPLVLTGGRAVAIMDERSDGYFDPDLTNAARPGVARFLVESAQVTEDGRIIPGDKNDRTPVMKHPEVEAIKFNPYDRRQMTGMNLLHATGVTRPHGTALMTFGGWGLDDGVVVSKEFAEANKILGKDGTMRSLVVGDKISDLHGNKGVISLIIDREADYETALANKDQSMIYASTIFRQNPDLDVVMSPFSAVGRFNGGTARELMQNPDQLTLPFKGARPGLMGQMRFIVTHKDVKSGTRVYDDEAVLAGRGRKASAQLAWALHSQGATEVLKEFYGPNGKAVANLREYLVVCGLDMDPDGTIKVADEGTYASRRLIEMPELQMTAQNRPDKAAMIAKFARFIETRGGDLEVPFELYFPARDPKEGGREVPRGEREGTWRLPLLSSQLRTGQMLDDGTHTAHEYTTQYLRIFEASCEYRFCQERLANEELSVETRVQLEERARRAHGAAQAAFSTITNGIIERQFTGKNNIFKESIMSARLPSSATAVWTADPRLDIDQLAMNSQMAEALGVTADDYVLVWRDPVLRDAGVRYLRVAIDDRLTGVAINPVMDKGFDGDFDGDSVAVVKLHSQKAHEDAMRKLTLEANLLDLGALEEVAMGDGQSVEVHPLMMQDSLDVKVTQHIKPEFVERFGALTMRANDIQFDYEEGTIDWQERLNANRALVRELSAYYREVLEGQYGDAALRFDSAQAHLESVKHACLDTGAKGSPAKLAAYAKHLGVDEKGVDHGKPLHTREEDQGVMIATAVKTAVGIAGAYSQRGVRALRNTAQKAILELTYPVTQSLLQAKHDPHEAMQKYTLLLSTVRELWRGRALERTATGWTVATDEKRRPRQATTQEWIETFLDLYRSKEGLNIPTVNPEHVKVVAEALTGPDGLMRDIEAVGSGGDRADAERHELPVGSTMDRLAYGGTFYDVCAAAHGRDRLFDGKQNALFAPWEVQRNWREQEAYERRYERRADPTRDVPAPELNDLVQRDVLVESDERAKERGMGRRSPLARTVRAPRPATVEIVEETKLDSDGFEYGP